MSRPYNASVDLVDRNVAEGRGDKVAFFHDAGETTYAALADLVARAAGAFAALGVGPEERVALCSPDVVEWPVAFLGAMRAGAVPVALSTLLRDEDYAFMLADSRATTLVVHASLRPRFSQAIASAPRLRRTIVIGDPTAPLAFETLVAEAPPAAAADTTEEDVAFWLYSSGSTGLPKGTIHRHASLAETARLYARGVLGLRETDVTYSAAKLFFAYGLGTALTFPLFAGASAVLRAARPTPELVVDTLQRSGATIFGGVPTLFASLLAHAEDHDVRALGRLRLCTSAGESLPEDVGLRFFQRFGAHILDGLGSTEMLHIFLSTRPDDVRYGTTGRAVPGYELRLVDDDGADVPDGELGELWVKGPTAASGYWNRREKSLATFVGAWTRTGDKYRRDEAGDYRCAGRTDDMMKVSGLWVSPVEVEASLGAHGDVLEAAVVGMLDDDGLLKPKAFVVLRPGRVASDGLADELKRWVKERLAFHKYPRAVVFVEALPKTATGKIQRFKLRGA